MKFKTVPFKHQKEVWDISKDAEAFALFMEQGTGKTKVILDTAVHLYNKGEIDLLLVIAPNGVHRNWIINEVPIHLAMEDHLYRSSWWALTMKGRDKKRYNKVVETNFIGLRIIAVNIEALSQKRGAEFVKNTAILYKTLIVIDESSKIKTPKAKRTKSLIQIGKQCEYKRILTGTPVTQGPLDLYTQFRFLGEPICGVTSFIAYKHTFGDWVKKMNYKTHRQYEELVEYKNLDLLKKEIQPISFRVTKAECLDLPAKIYERRYIALSNDQLQAYKSLSLSLKAEISEHEITTALVLTKILRLQQILGGFIGTDEGETIQIPGSNPRLEVLEEVIEETQGKIIIWSRFVKEIESIIELLPKEQTVAFYGGVNNNDRDVAISRFQNDPTCRYFIGQQHSAGYGLTLTAASTVIYYSNDFSLEARLQSEDRAHRIGQKNNVTYIDFEAIGTIDEQIITALRNKKSIANEITGDEIHSWL